MQNEEEMEGWRDGLNRALYEFREEYFGELRECAEEIRSDVSERLRAPFFCCHFDVWRMWGCGGWDEDVVYLL